MFYIFSLLLVAGGFRGVGGLIGACYLFGGCGGMYLILSFWVFSVSLIVEVVRQRACRGGGV